MSNNVNTQLLEEASFYIEYFTGTIMARYLENDVSNNDLDSLRQHVNEARLKVHEIEYTTVEECAQ